MPGSSGHSGTHGTQPSPTGQVEAAAEVLAAEQRAEARDDPVHASQVSQVLGVALRIRRMTREATRAQWQGWVFKAVLSKGQVEAAGGGAGAHDDPVHASQVSQVRPGAVSRQQMPGA